MITLRGGRVPEPFHRSPFSVVAALVPLAQQMAKRSRPFTDEALNTQVRYQSHEARRQKSSRAGYSATSKKKNSRLISALEMTRSAVTSQESPGQASGDRLHVPGRTGNPEVTEPGASDLEDFLDARVRTAESIVVIYLDATSPKIRLRKHRETDCKLWLKRDNDMINMLSLGVQLIWNLVTRVEENVMRTFGQSDLTSFQMSRFVETYIRGCQDLIAQTRRTCRTS